jgi:hypothetical protein
MSFKAGPERGQVASPGCATALIVEERCVIPSRQNTALLNWITEVLR